MVTWWCCLVVSRYASCVLGLVYQNILLAWELLRIVPVYFGEMNQGEATEGRRKEG